MTLAYLGLSFRKEIKLVDKVVNLVAQLVALPIWIHSSETIEPVLNLVTTVQMPSQQNRVLLKIEFDL